MKNIILTAALMLSSNLLAQPDQSTELESFLKITDEEFIAQIQEDLDLVPPKELSVVCLHIEETASLLPMVCELQKGTATEIENRACARSIELINITARECNKKLKSYGE